MRRCIEGSRFLIKPILEEFQASEGIAPVIRLYEVKDSKLSSALNTYFSYKLSINGYAIKRLWYKQLQNIM